MQGRGLLSTWNVPALTEAPATAETQSPSCFPAPTLAHLKEKVLCRDQSTNSLWDPESPYTILCHAKISLGGENS